MIETTPAVIGHHLAIIRERAGIKQAALAKQITWSPASLSRVESGERELTHEELETILKAIGTSDAIQFAERLGRRWSVMRAPSLDHPDQDSLWAAEQAGQQLALLAAEQAPASFHRRIEEYLEELRLTGSLVHKRDHTIAFIGSIGVGKSTAICRMSALEIPQADGNFQPVLEAGGGGVTVCEVHVYTGPEYGIIVEPCSDEEIRQHVNDFVDLILRSNTSENTDSDSQGISKEIERAIRNMSGLKVRKEKIDGKLVRTDDAKILASHILSQKDLIVEILSKMQLPKRDTRYIWFDNTKGKPPLVWLKESFEAINNGRHEDFTLPKRIEVILPMPLLNGTDLAIRVVDTKGIDRTAARADLEVHLNDPHTLAILCSNFNNAPGAEARILLERAKDAGVRSVALKAALVALPRPEEALAVKDDAGEKVETVAEGYDLKGDQVANSLASLGLQDLSIAFFNAREDSPEVLRSFVIEKLNKVRTHLVEKLQSTTSTVLQFIENRESEQEQAILREAAKHLNHWLDTNKQLPSLSQQIQNSLINQLSYAHTSTIHASIRRGGDWPSLNYSYQLGHGAKVLANQALGKKIDDFKAIANLLKTNPEYGNAQMLITQSESVLLTAFDEVLRKMQVIGETLFEQELKRDNEFWNLCLAEWGMGPGYRERVTNRCKNWFDDGKREELNQRVQTLLSNLWAESLARVSSLLIV